jgi:hypothetical protein
MGRADLSQRERVPSFPQHGERGDAITDDRAEHAPPFQLVEERRVMLHRR